MKLYGFDMSTPVNKVRYVANYLKLEYDYEYIDAFKGEHQSEEHLKRHPVGKVPVLVDDGFVLFESNAIIKYLAAKQGSGLYPQDHKQRAVVDQWIDFTSIHIGNAMNKVFGNRVVFPHVGIEVDERSLEDGLSFLDKFLPVIEKQLQQNSCLAGQRLSLADFNLLATLDPIEMAGIDVSGYPALAAYRQKLQKEAYYQSCHQVYGESFGKAA